jgi:hypothetical protein
MINVNLKFCIVTDFQKLWNHYEGNILQEQYQLRVCGESKFIFIFELVKDETFSPPSSYDNFTTICKLTVILNIFISLRFKILKIIVFLDVMACTLAYRYQHFGGNYCSNLQGKNNFYPEDGGNRIFWNIFAYLPKYVASH